MDGCVIISNMNRNGRASYGKTFERILEGLSHEKNEKGLWRLHRRYQRSCDGRGTGGHNTQFLVHTARPEPSSCKYVNGDIQGGGLDLLE